MIWGFPRREKWTTGSRESRRASVVSVVVRFWQRREEAARDVRRAGVLWVWVSVSSYYRLNKMERSGRGVVSRW
jgi:hypothetical protein